MIRIAWIGKSLEDKRIRLSYGVFLFYVMNLPLLILAHQSGTRPTDMCSPPQVSCSGVMLGAAWWKHCETRPESANLRKELKSIKNIASLNLPTFYHGRMPPHMLSSANVAASFHWRMSPLCTYHWQMSPHMLSLANVATYVIIGECRHYVLICMHDFFHCTNYPHLIASY